MTNSPRSPVPLTAPKLLTIPQVAALLGVHRDTVYNLIAQGDLAVTDMATGRTKTGAGRPKSRIREDVLAEFIERRTRTAAARVPGSRIPA